MRLLQWCLICHLLALVLGENVTKRAANGITQTAKGSMPWLSELADQLQPQLERYLEQQVKQSLEDKIGSTLSSVVKKVIGPFQFSTFNVSDLHLKVDEMRVLKLDHESDVKDKNTSPIKMDVGITLKGPVDVGMALGISTIYLTEVTIKVKARVTAAGPIPRPPFVSGIQLSLLEKPWIDFKFSGATKFLAKQLLNVLDEVIESKMGYPNLLAMQLDPIADARTVRSMNPTGVLAVNIKRAKHLLDEEGFFKRLFKLAKPDTYVRSQLGNVKHETKAILHNENPVYGDEWIELPLDTLEGYSLDFSVFERSPTSDVLYGTAHVHDVKSAILNKSTELSLDIALSDEFKDVKEANSTKGGGQLVIQLKWIHLGQEGKQAVSTISNDDSKHVNKGDIKSRSQKLSKGNSASPVLTSSSKGNASSPFLSKRPVALLYPGQSKQVMSLFLENLTVVEMLKPPKDMGGEKHSKIQVGGEEVGSLVPLGGLARLPLNMIIENASGNKTRIHAAIHREFLFLVGQNETKSGVDFKFTCESLDSPVKGSLKMGSVLLHPLMTIQLEDEGKTAKMNLTMHVTVRHLKSLNQKRI